MALAKPEAVHLPLLISNAAKASMEELQSLERDASRVLSGIVGSDMSVQGMKEVSAVCSKAKRNETLIMQMMSTLGKIQM